MNYETDSLNGWMFKAINDAIKKGNYITAYDLATNYLIWFEENSDDRPAITAMQNLQRYAVLQIQLQAIEDV